MCSTVAAGRFTSDQRVTDTGRGRRNHQDSFEQLLFPPLDRVILALFAPSTNRKERPVKNKWSSKKRRNFASPFEHSVPELSEARVV